MKKKNPAAAADFLAKEADSNLYRAEAAYWAAVEAMMDLSESGPKGATTRPMSQGGDTRTVPTSRQSAP